MSLRIQNHDVKEVLLADGWHKVDTKSFWLNAYEFLEDDYLAHGGGNSGVCATGFQFDEPDTKTTISGPLTAILGVRT